MVEPVTIIMAVTAFLSLLSTGINWFKKRTDTQSVVSSSLPMIAYTYPPAILPSPLEEDIPKVEYENSKRKKKPLASYESNDHNSSSNSGFPIGLIFVIVLVLAVMGFVVYQKHNKLRENRFRFRQTEREFESPPSPPTTQTDFNLTNA